MTQKWIEFAVAKKFIFWDKFSSDRVKQFMEEKVSSGESVVEREYKKKSLISLLGKWLNMFFRFWEKTSLTQNSC